MAGLLMFEIRPIGENGRFPVKKRRCVIADPVLSGEERRLKDRI
jgi:hypothetical protein